MLILLSRLTGPEREEDEPSAGAARLIYCMFPDIFHFRSD